MAGTALGPKMRGPPGSPQYLQCLTQALAQRHHRLYSFLPLSHPANDCVHVAVSPNCDQKHIHQFHLVPLPKWWKAGLGRKNSHGLNKRKYDFPPMLKNVLVWGVLRCDGSPIAAIRGPVLIMMPTILHKSVIHSQVSGWFQMAAGAPAVKPSVHAIVSGEKTGTKSVLYSTWSSSICGLSATKPLLFFPSCFVILVLDHIHIFFLSVYSMRLVNQWFCRDIGQPGIGRRGPLSGSKWLFLASIPVERLASQWPGPAYVGITHRPMQACVTRAICPPAGGPHLWASCSPYLTANFLVPRGCLFPWDLSPLQAGCGWSVQEIPSGLPDHLTP